MADDIFKLIEENIKEYLPEYLKDANVFIHIVNNPVFGLEHELVIEDTDKNYCIAIEPVKNEYARGIPLEQILQTIIDIGVPKTIQKLPSDQKFEEIKDKLTLKLMDPDLANDSSNLEKLIYKELGPFIITYGVKMNDSQLQEESLPVTKEALENWNMTLDELHQKASEIANENYHGLLFPIDEAGDDYIDLAKVENLLGKEAPLNIDFSTSMNPGFFLTTEEIEAGANILAKDRILGDIANLIDSNFYVIPRSKDLVMIIPEGYMEELRSSKVKLHLMNLMGIPNEKVLSNKITYYDRNSDELIEV